MRKLKHILYVLVFFLIASSIKPILAQAPTGTTAINTPQVTQELQKSEVKTAVDNTWQNDVSPTVPRNFHTLTQTAIIEVLAGTICALSGRDPLHPNGNCLGYNPENGQIGYVTQKNGVAQFMGRLIGGTITIPVSGSDYASYALSNFGGTKKAYAQSNTAGFGRLSPLINVWSKFRDIAYLAFVLAFTIIGLAIMFRVKIDARTVMTIQNQIPKIIIALIMVTLSFAIAGLLIDFMYVSMYFILQLFSSINPSTHLSINGSIFSVVNNAFSPNISDNLNPGGLAFSAGTSGIVFLAGDLGKMIGGVFSSILASFLDSTISSLFRIPFTPFNILDLGCDAFDFLGKFTFNGLGLGKVPYIGSVLKSTPIVGGLFGGGGCNFAESLFQLTFTFLFGAITFLIVLIAILYTLFRIWFTLIKSFVYVLLDVIIGPLWIAAGIFPASKLGFGTWIRHLAAHLSVFPMTFAIILLGKTIMDAVGQGNGQLFSPPLVGDAIGGNTDLAAIIGFGFILSIPSILDRTRKFIGAIDFGLIDIKKSFGAGRSLAQGGLQSATSHDIEYKQNKTTGQWEPHGIGWGPRRVLKGFGLVR